MVKEIKAPKPIKKPDRTYGITEDQLREYLALKTQHLRHMTFKETLSIPAIVRMNGKDELKILRDLLND